jgi:hypothetical protein
MTERPVCFVIMPFGQPSDGSKFMSELIYKQVIMPAFEEAKSNYDGKEFANATIFRIDSEHFAGDIQDNIVESLHHAAVVVADVSDNNANVFFELGFRHALGKPILCITRRAEPPAFWSGKFQIINYTNDNARVMIKDGIRHGFEHTGSATERVLDGLRILARSEQDGGSFRDRFAEWRLRIAKDQIASVQSGKWRCELKTNLSYMHHLLSGAAALLNKGEIYRSVTNSKFWIREDNSLLRANRSAAVNNGIRIERVFILTEEEVKNACTDRKGVLHRALNDQVKAAAEAINATENPNAFVVKGFVVRNNKEQADYGNFALLCGSSGASAVALEPVTAADGTFTDLQIEFLPLVEDKRKADRLSSNFDIAFSNGKLLVDILSGSVKKSKRRDVDTASRGRRSR